MTFKKWLQAFGKLDYVQGTERPDVECILCAVRDDDVRVKSLKYYQDDLIFITLNLYPYNPGHSLIVPTRHCLKFQELTKEEILHLSRAIQGLQLMFNEIYSPHGYNIGINQGAAGASIDHLHWHLVPRYTQELGFIDIVGNTRVVVEGLDGVMKKVQENVDKFLNSEFFKGFD